MVKHATEQNTEVAVKLTIAQWREIHSALRMVAKTCEEAHANGDMGAAHPEPFEQLAALVWQHGVTPSKREEKLRARGWGVKKSVRFVPSEGPSDELD